MHVRTFLSVEDGTTQKKTRISTVIATVHGLKFMLKYPWKLIRNLGNVLAHNK